MPAVTPDASMGPDASVAPLSPARPGRYRSEPPRYGSVGPIVAGIDVSHWNGIVPFRLVRAVGARFVILKVTQGTDIVDPAHRRHLEQARGADLIVGPYHFYDYTVGGRAQADHFLDTVADLDLLDRSLPMVVDVECFPRFGAADQAWVRVQLRAFVGRIYQRTGRLPMVYTSWVMWERVTGGDSSFGHLPLWVACWRCARPALPAGWDDWDFWQVGSIVLPNGDRVGSDVFAGTERELRRLGNQRRKR